MILNIQGKEQISSSDTRFPRLIFHPHNRKLWKAIDAESVDEGHEFSVRRDAILSVQQKPNHAPPTQCFVVNHYYNYYPLVCFALRFFLPIIFLRAFL